MMKRIRVLGKTVLRMSRVQLRMMSLSKPKVEPVRVMARLKTMQTMPAKTRHLIGKTMAA